MMGLFVFIGAVFLLNVLVAVLNIEYSKLADSARWRSEQAAAILDLQLWELLFDPRAKVRSTYIGIPLACKTRKEKEP